MKKQSKKLISLIALLAMLCTGYATLSFGAPSHGIKYTKHNMSVTRRPIGEIGGGDWRAASETEVCIFCHTPHNAAAGKKFLWNRVDSTATFQLYTASQTLGFTKSQGSTISSVSKLCMSCHDGGTALNAMANPRNPAVVMQDETWGNQLADMYDPEWGFDTWGPNIGEGHDPTVGPNPDPGGILVNDHPISFIYKQSCDNDPDINKELGVCDASSIGGLPLWFENIGGTAGYRVECVTCHDPHINANLAQGGDPAYAFFLRKNNSSSGLCFTCHNK